MITRRSVLFSGVGPALARTNRAFAAGEFWNDKQPSDWSEKDVERLLTKSPWAKDGSVQMNFSGMQQGGRGGGGGMGGGGGEMGGGGGGMGGGAPQVKAVVRWESAAPMRAARKRETAGKDDGFYVISVSGLPAMGAGRRPQSKDATGKQAAPSPEAIAERRKQMQEQMKQASSLAAKGKDPIAPASIESGEGIVVFFFAKEGAPSRSTRRNSSSPPKWAHWRSKRSSSSRT